MAKSPEKLKREVGYLKNRLAVRRAVWLDLLTRPGNRQGWKRLAFVNRQVDLVRESIGESSPFRLPPVLASPALARVPRLVFRSTFPALPLASIEIFP